MIMPLGNTEIFTQFRGIIVGFILAIPNNRKKIPSPYGGICLYEERQILPTFHFKYLF